MMAASILSIALRKSASRPRARCTSSFSMVIGRLHPLLGAQWHLILADREFGMAPDLRGAATQFDQLPRYCPEFFGDTPRRRIVGMDIAHQPCRSAAPDD